MSLPMRDARSKLTQVKIVNRLYRMPLKLNRVGLVVSKVQYVGDVRLTVDIVHMFFNCSKLTNYWQSVMKKVCNSLGGKI